MSTNLISSLNARLEAMSTSERAIAEVILDAPEAVVGLSSQALAKRCNVSQSSIIKFCQKVGFQGFPALKIALSAETARSENAQQIHAGIFSDDSIGAVAKKLFASKIAALSETMKANPNAVMDAAVAQISAANRIIIMGVGGSALVAQDLASKLAKFGKSVISGGDSHIQLANLTSFSSDDLLISISYSGSAREVRVAVEFAQAHGIPVLHIGAYHKAPLPDVVLQCVADENVVRSFSIATRTAQMAITDLLFVLFVQGQGDVAARISDSHGLVHKIK